MKTAALIHDNLDDRREMLLLLDKLPPWKRLRFLWWCCRRAKDGLHRPEPTPFHRGGSLEVWSDLWALAMNFGLDMDKALDKLVEVVREHGR